MHNIEGYLAPPVVNTLEETESFEMFCILFGEYGPCSVVILANADIPVISFCNVYSLAGHCSGAEASAVWMLYKVEGIEEAD